MDGATNNHRTYRDEGPTLRIEIYIGIIKQYSFTTDMGASSILLMSTIMKHASNRIVDGSIIGSEISKHPILLNSVECYVTGFINWMQCENSIYSMVIYCLPSVNCAILNAIATILFPLRSKSEDLLLKGLYF